jgi:hypothetical protein
MRLSRCEALCRESGDCFLPIKPTDFVGTIRALLVRRAQQLYGGFCEILLPFLRIPQPSSPEWDVNEFRWADPVGTTSHMPAFLEFRRVRLEKLINASGSVGEESQST